MNIPTTEYQSVMSHEFVFSFFFRVFLRAVRLFVVN